MPCFVHNFPVLALQKIIEIDKDLTELQSNVHYVL